MQIDEREFVVLCERTTGSYYWPVPSYVDPGRETTTEVIRCRDCEHSYIHDMTAMYPDGSRNARYCGRWSYLMQMVDDSDFCSFGDRREDE